MESDLFYHTIETNDSDGNTTMDNNVEDVLATVSYTNSSLDRKEKFKLVHQRWEELYDYKGSMRLKDAMKRHLYSNMYGQDALGMAHMVMDGFNPLSS